MTDSQNSTGDQPNDQPQYGQYQQPEYGAMANQYPSGYDPYVYGKPEAKPADGQQQVPVTANGQPQQPAANPYPANANPAAQYGQQYGQPYGQPNAAAGQQPNQQYGQPNQWQQPYGNMPVYQQPVPPHTPRYINGIDMDDPNQNPLYGHWDMLSIVSFVCALFFPLPVLPAIMGAIAMRRTKLFHMKGFWLAFVAVFVNIFFTIMEVWLAINGISMFDYYQQMLDMLSGGYGGNSDGSISA